MRELLKESESESEGSDLDSDSEGPIIPSACRAVLNTIVDLGREAGGRHSYLCCVFAMSAR